MKKIFVGTIFGFFYAAIGITNCFAAGADFTIDNFRYKNDAFISSVDVKMIVDIKNNLDKRAKGELCVFGFDKDGFEVKLLSMDTITLGIGASDAATPSRLLKKDVAKQITKIVVFVEKVVCSISSHKSEAISNVGYYEYIFRE